MCLIPGLADGRLLDSTELLDEALAVDVPCRCGHGGHGHGGHDHGGHGSGRRSVSRRELIRGGAGLAAGALGGGAVGVTGSWAAAGVAGAAPGHGHGDRVVMLGVNGGPVLSTRHCQPALCLIAGGTAYLVDCGGDTARQMVVAGLGFDAVRHVFFTHQHIDHTGGYPEFALLGWQYHPSPLDARVTVWGPPPIADMHHRLQQLYATGISLFETIGSPPFASLMRARELRLPRHGIVDVMSDDNVRVRATRVFHGAEVHDAYAYRFDIKATGRSVVFSGDTVPRASLVALAQDADLLVHEAQNNSVIPEFVRHTPRSGRAALRHHLETSHTDVHDVPRVAKEAGARRVAMCHYSLDPDVHAYSVAAKRAARRLHYTGEVLAPSELDAIAV